MIDPFTSAREARVGHVHDGFSARLFFAWSNQEQ
jgi:hypothetical protein